MGWAYMHREKGKKSVDFYREMFEFEGGKNKVLDVASIGFQGEAYVALDTPNGVIAVVVLQRWVPNSYHNFGYKAIEESQGPCETRCPLRIMEKLSPVEQLYSGDDAKWANDWREACYARLTAKLAKPSVKKGATVKFSQPIKFTSGAEADTFVYEKGSRFTAKQGYGRYHIANWRDRDYEVVG